MKNNNRSLHLCSLLPSTVQYTEHAYSHPQFILYTYQREREPGLIVTKGLPSDSKHNSDFARLGIMSGSPSSCHCELAVCAMSELKNLRLSSCSVTVCSDTQGPNRAKVAVESNFPLFGNHFAYFPWNY